jgi:hypothetical protein
MSGIKLEYNKESIIIYKKNYYQINSVKQWVFLTKFIKAYLITKHPYGIIETIIDRKFVYNQDYELECDIDFNYRYIYPLGNFPENINFYLIDIVPFTGTFNGNNHIIKNINIIDCNYNGLFGITKSGSINNLTIQNVTILGGVYNGALVGKSYSTEISNINIVGNILMKGTNCSCFIGLNEGNSKNIKIVVDGEIESENKSLLSNYYYGNMENISIVTNFKESINCFNIINGRIKNIIFISWITIPNVIYNQTKYHQISNCYYFQINEEELPEPQIIYNYYYRNLKKANYDNIKNTNQWNKIGDHYYLNDQNMNNELLKYYDNNSNIINDLYLDSDGNFINSDIKPFDKNNILEMCKKMEGIYLNETKCSQELDELNIKNSNIRLECIKANLDYDEKLVSENTIHKYQEYDSDSDYVSSEEINKKVLISEIKNEVILKLESDSDCTSSEEINKKIIINEKIKNEAVLKIKKELELLEKEIIHQTP